MKFSLHALKSRIARKAVVYFLVAALLPLLFLSFITYFKFGEQLNKLSGEYVHQETKMIGHNIYNQLRILRNELVRIARNIEGLKSIPDISHPVTDTTLVKNFFYINKKGEVIPVDHTKKPFHAEELFNYIYENKILGKPLLLSFPELDVNDYSKLYMIVPMPRTSESMEFFGAELNTLNVLSIEMLINRNELICILSESGNPVYCNKPFSNRWIAKVLEHYENKNSGYFSWQDGDQFHFTSFWSIFLDSQFQIDRWTVAVSRLEDPSSGVVSSLKTSLLLVAIFTIFMVILLTLPIIRSRVKPLEIILNATKKLSRGDFNTKIDIQTRDEFQEIGDAFNNMTSKLEEVFDYQSTLSVIGTQLLSCEQPKPLFHIIHRQLINLDVINGVGVIYFDTKKNIQHSFYCPVGKDTSYINEAITYRDIHDIPDHVWLGKGEDIVANYPLLEVLKPEAGKNYRIFPVFVDSHPIAIITVELSKMDDSLILFLEQVSDIISSALNKIILTREIKFQANHDALTDLPNRLLLNDRLGHAISKARRDESIFAILFFDLDRFKEINDSLGHSLGDELLKIVAERLASNLRSEDTLARLGGDEFIILAESLHEPEGAAVLAEKLTKAVREPYYCSGHELYITTSIGISLFPKDGEDIDTLMRNADAAMYLAKDDSLSSYKYYSPELTVKASDRVQMEKNLRNAILKSQFKLVYQPQYQLASGEICGLEALIRWEHPSLGNISPYHFIPIAEETGLIYDIGLWVLECACRQITEWKTSHNLSGRVAVNLSTKQLKNQNLLQSISTVLKTTGCDPQWLELEVTEGYLLSDPANAIKQLQALRDMGITLAIDDFGTGFSSLSYLKTLPITKLKIDKSFIQDIPHDEEDTSITKTIISLGQNLGLIVTAEGVETEEQRQFLIENGCDEMQGYLLSKPKYPEELQF